MSLYSVYLKRNNKDDQIEDVICLKDGWSWMAFFFGFLWFTYHKMLKESLILIIAYVFFANLSQNNFLGSIDFFILQVGFAALVATNASFWRASYLKKRNYQFTSSILAGSDDIALVKFISHFSSDTNYDSKKFSDAIINPKSYFNKSCFNFLGSKKESLNSSN